VPLEGLRAWALAGLQAVLPFEHAVWGFGAGAGSASGAGGAAATPACINSVHLYGLESSELADADSLASCAPLICCGPPGRVSGGCDSGTVPETEADAALALLRRNGLVHVVSFSTGSSVAPGRRQCLTLARGRGGAPFAAEELHCFEQLAPHLFQAWDTARSLYAALQAGRAEKPPRRATAIVDRAGGLHNATGNLEAMLQCEWPGWQAAGNALPPVLASLVAPHTGADWQYVGTRVVADFHPVNDMFLMTARPRAADDTLTERERAIARLYAHGSSYKEIAKSFKVSPATVRAHVRNIFRKLKVTKKAHLAELL
jgi:DNA-binding CsgD family transcriptional regulator